MSKTSKHTKHAKRSSGRGTVGNLSTPAKVIIVIFAVLMALALMLPFLSTVVASNQQAEQQKEEQNSATSQSSSDDSADSGDDSSSDASLDGVPENLQSVAKTYAGRVQKLEAKLDDDPDNLATLINLADDYMNWGYSSLQSSSTDEETSYSNGLLKKAMDYFDRYLALNDSNSAKVDRALCQYYTGDTSGATSALEQITTDAPDFGPGWANLGMVYEQAGNTDKAIDAYQKAVDADPNDEYGAKTFANQRLVALNKNTSSSSDSSSSSSELAQDGSGSSSSSSSSGANALANTIQNNSGLKL